MRLLATNAVILVLVLASVPVWTGRRKQEKPSSPSSPPSSEPPSTKRPPTTRPPTTRPPTTRPPTRRPPPKHPPKCPPPKCPPPSCPRTKCPTIICPKCTKPSPARRPPATRPPSRRPPATRPPSKRPPATRPPSKRPPATRPPSRRPPATRPPSKRLPATRPPSGRPPATRPPTKRHPATRPATALPSPSHPSKARSFRRPSSRASQFRRPGYRSRGISMRGELNNCPLLSGSSLFGSVPPSRVNSSKMSTEVLVGFDEGSISGKCLLPRSPHQNEFIAIETCGETTNLKSLCNLTVSAASSKNKYQKKCERPSDKLFPLQLGSELQVTFHLSVPVEYFENRFLCKLYRRPGTPVAASDTVTVDTDTPDIDSTKVLLGSDENSISGQCTFNANSLDGKIISVEMAISGSSKAEILSSISISKTRDTYFSKSVLGPRKMIGQVRQVWRNTFQLTFHLSISKLNIGNKFRCSRVQFVRKITTEWATVNGI